MSFLRHFSDAFVLPKAFPRRNPSVASPHPAGRALPQQGRGRRGHGRGWHSPRASRARLCHTVPARAGRQPERAERERAGGHSALLRGRRASSSRCRPDRRDGDVDQKFATVEILRPRLSLALVLIKGYSIIMPQGEGFLAHNEPCVIAFVSRLGCNTDGSHSSNSDISPRSIVQTGALRSHPGPPCPTSLSPRLSCSECSVPRTKSRFP